MARIGEDEIERLKKEISIERLAEARGIALKKQGSDLHGLCPFHEDREPSLVISPEKNLWHCLRACQTGGSVIEDFYNLVPRHSYLDYVSPIEFELKRHIEEEAA